MQELTRAKSVEEFRNSLLDDINKIRTGEMTPAVAKAVTSMASQVLSSVRIDLSAHKLDGTKPNIGFIKPSIISKATTPVVSISLS